MSETEVVTEESENLGTIIREAIGKDQFLSFSRSGESPIQWIQKLHVLDDQDLPEWPMLTPLKVQMQKCDRCDQLFCSSINLRRHVRVQHLQPKSSDPSVDGNKLRKFWDELSLDGIKEIVSIENANLEAAKFLRQVEAFNDHEALKAREIADTLVEQEDKDKKSGKGMQKPVQSNKQKKKKPRNGKAKTGTRRDEDASGSGSGRAEPQNFERDIVPQRDNEEEEANHPSDTRPDEDASGSGPGHAEPQNVGGEGDIALQMKKQKEKARKSRQKERKAEAKASGSAHAEPQNVDGFTRDAVPQRREEEEKKKKKQMTLQTHRQLKIPQGLVLNKLNYKRRRRGRRCSFPKT